MLADRIAIKAGLFSGPLDELDSLHLCGSRCGSCGEMTLGSNLACPNCGGEDISQVALGDEGRIYTFTVVRHRPPGNYQGPEPFVPFGLGLVEVDDVIRVMAPLKAATDQLEIGKRVRFSPYVLRTDGEGREVIAFAYDVVEG